MKKHRHPERREGSPAAAVSGETTVAAGDDGEILHVVQDDGRVSTGTRTDLLTAANQDFWLLFPLDGPL
jgi:hypothetical protein